MKRTAGGRLAVVVLAVTALHAAIAAAAASPAFFYLNVGTAQRVFGGSNGEWAFFKDGRIFHEYASRMLSGAVPYRDFAVEYPIGALPVFLLPRLVSPSLAAYHWWFAAEMIAVDGLLVWLVAKRSEGTVGVRRGLTWYTLGLATLGALPVARYDLVPAALAFAAALAWEGGRTGLGGFLAGLGGLVKLFPALVAGPGGLDDRGGRSRGWLVLAITIGVGAAAWVAIGGDGVLVALRFHSGRGLEIESVYAGALIVAARLAGLPLSHVYEHTSIELVTPWAAPVAAVAPAVQAAAIGLVLWKCRWDRRRDVPRYAGACVLAFLAFGKVLSPQYLVWCLPFAATLDGRSGRWARPIFVLCGALTTLVYVWAGVGLVTFHPLAVALLNARNLLLVALLGLTIAGRRG